MRGCVQARTNLRHPARKITRICLEDKTTKRFLLILAVLVFCFGAAALAEGNPQPPEADSQTQPDSGASGAPLVIQPLVPDEEAGETADPQTGDAAPAQEEASRTEDGAPVDPNPEEPAQEEQQEVLPGEPEQSAAEHDAGYHTREIPHGQTVYRATDDKQTHEAVTAYDLYCAECQRVIAENCRTEQLSEPHSWTSERREPTCSQEGSARYVCTQCGMAYEESLPPLDHVWDAWEDRTDYSLPACIREEIKVRRCVNCGKEETVTVPAQGHQWEAVSYTEATCTENGAAVRRCTVCGKEETIVLPALGHTYVQQDGQDGQAICAICGAAKEASDGQNQKSHMYYNNTVTSFGPTTRELIGGSVWNRVTPVDLSKEGVFTYPLIASNQYTVGTATLINSEECQEVNYKLSSSKINVHSESLVVYPDLQALKTGEHARAFDFNEPIDLKTCFGEDAHVIVAITLKADYDANGAGIRRFLADQNSIDQMMEMLQ